jgi:peptide-methionine (S)-S-oxide reductase
MSKKATLGGGCFWCLEAVFQNIQGVEKVISGYAGGTVAHPSYEQVCTGDTGHAEVVQIEYDPEQVGFEELLETFWKAHDPTTVNRQGADIGPQYRSIILYHDEEQRRTAEESIRRLDESGAYEKRVVTEVVPLDAFYPAEEYHQDYFRKNPYAGYCSFVIRPKLKKLHMLD